MASRIEAASKETIALLEQIPRGRGKMSKAKRLSIAEAESRARDGDNLAIAAVRTLLSALRSLATGYPVARLENALADGSARLTTTRAAVQAWLASNPPFSSFTTKATPPSSVRLTESLIAFVPDQGQSMHTHAARPVGVQFTED